MENINSFSLTVHGNVQKAEFPEESNICVKIYTVLTKNWKFTNGDTSTLSSYIYRGSDSNIFVDLPFEIAVKGTSPFQWPRIVLNCFSKKNSGTDCLVGYGVVSLPTMPGKHKCRTYCFLPESSSTVQKIMTKLRGLNAEFVDPLLPASADGRYACRTSTKGYVDIEVTVSIKSSESSCSFFNTTSAETTELMIPTSVSELAKLTTDATVIESAEETPQIET